MLQENSLFINYEWFIKAAAHVEENLLSKPYNNGLDAGRWQNQRTIVLLENEKVVEAPPKYLFGIKEAITLSRNKEKGKLVSLEEIIECYNKENGQAIEQNRLAPLTEEMIGQVNIPLMEEDYSAKVLKIVHRPNHDLPHSIRVAAHIPVIHDLISTKDQYALNDKETEKLQLMMLFSVAGREDETGFADHENIQSGYLYQAYRAVDAIAFLKYCLQNWEHYQHVFDNKEDLYQCALVIELMGYPELPELSEIKPTPIMTALFKNYSHENFTQFKKIIESEYSYCNKLKSYLTEDLRSLFYNIGELDKGKLQVHLEYMNMAHQVDLMRCYFPGNYKQLGGNFFKTIDLFYCQLFNKKMHLDEKSNFCATDHLVNYLVFSRKMLNIFGEKTTTNIVMSSELKPIKKNLASLEAFIYHQLITVKEFKFDDIKNLTFNVVKNKHAKAITFKKFVEFLQGVEKDFLIKHHFVSGSKENLTLDALCSLIAQYATKLCTTTGEFKISPRRFDFVSSSNNPFSNTYAITTAIDDLPKPFTQGYENLFRKTLREQCGEGVAILKTNTALILEFPNNEIAKKVINTLKETHLITREIPFLGDEQKKIAITKEEYDQLKYFLKFKPLTVTKKHSTQDNFIDESGNITAVKLIEKIEAVICLHNGSKQPGNTQSGLDFYVSQLENPTTIRPLRHPDRDFSESDRQFIWVNGNKIKRGIKEEIPIGEQPPLVFNPPRRERWEDDDMRNPIPRPICKNRGLPKNTLFTKKNSHTLMMPNGKQKFFAGTKKTYPYYFPVGILSDVLEVSLKEEYVWGDDAATTGKFWVGKQEPFPPRKSFSLKELQKRLKKQAKENAAPEWNELLIGSTKTAVKALVCIESTWTQGSNPVLTNRLNTILQAKKIQEKYGIEVPLLIADGKNLPYLYTEKSMEKDIEKVITLLKEKIYPYFQDSPENGPFQGKLVCLEQALLLEFFVLLTGVPCNEKLTMYDVKSEFKKDHPNENYKKFVLEANEHNSAVLANYIHKLTLDVSSCIKQLNLLGGQQREEAYLKQKFKETNDVKALLSLLQRNATLGHKENVNLILKKLGQTDIVELLLDKRNTGMHADIEGLILMWAIENEYKDIVNLFLTRKDKLLAYLIYAAQNSHEEMAELLLNKIEKNMNIGSAVEYAVKRGDKKIIALILMKSGAAYALKYAAKNGDKEIITMIFDKIGIAKAGEALMRAAETGDKNICKLILAEVGKDISHYYIGEALEKAAKNGRKKIVELILDWVGKGVMAYCKSKALEYAAENNDKEMITLILDKLGEEVDAGEALVRAVEMRKKGIVKLILNKGKNIGAYYRNRAFDKAVENGYKAILELILDKLGKQINTYSKNKALEYATEKGKKDIFELILDKVGKDISIHHIRLALKMAVKKDHKEIVELLKFELQKIVKHQHQLKRTSTLIALGVASGLVLGLHAFSISLPVIFLGGLLGFAAFKKIQAWKSSRDCQIAKAFMIKAKERELLPEEKVAFNAGVEAGQTTRGYFKAFSMKKTYWEQYRSFVAGKHVAIHGNAKVIEKIQRGFN